MSELESLCFHSQGFDAWVRWPRVRFEGESFLSCPRIIVHIALVFFSLFFPFTLEEKLGLISRLAADNSLQRRDPDRRYGNHPAAVAGIGNWRLTCSHCWLACSSCVAELRRQRYCVPLSPPPRRRHLLCALVSSRQRRSSRLARD